MTVSYFCYLCTDDTVEIRIYDMNPAIENEVFVGSMHDAIYSEWEGYEVLSYDLDPQAGLIVNIDTSEN